MYFPCVVHAHISSVWLIPFFQQKTGFRCISNCMHRTCASGECVQYSKLWCAGKRAGFCGRRNNIQTLLFWSWRDSPMLFISYEPHNNIMCYANNISWCEMHKSGIYSDAARKRGGFLREEVNFQCGYTLSELRGVLHIKICYTAACWAVSLFVSFWFSADP
jgi:hypothetical protein